MKLNRHGSDKRPEYMAVYERICEDVPHRGVVIELGVLNGESLKMWQTALPDATVIGVDNNPAAHWPDGVVKVVADQADVEAIAAWSTVAHLVVDDASHQCDATVQSFRRLWPLVAPGGWYVVEDWDAHIRYPHEDDYRFMESVPRMLARRAVAGRDQIAECVIVPGLVAVRKAKS